MGWKRSISRAVERAENLKMEREFYAQQLEIETLVCAIRDALSVPDGDWQQKLRAGLERIGRND